MILVLAGTADGRAIAERLSGEGRSVLASAAGAYGESLLSHIPGVITRQGALAREELVDLIRREKIGTVVDATHPYAVLASETAAQAAAEAGVPYVRFERWPSELPVSPLVHRVSGFAEAAALAAGLVCSRAGSSPCAAGPLSADTRGVAEADPGAEKVVFLTTGSKALALLVPLLRDAGARVVARVLPEAAALEAAASAGLGPAEIVAAQGPFSAALNREMFRHWGAGVVVAKDSGSPGGTAEKAEAAIELGIPFVIVARPPAREGAVHDMEALIELVHRR